MLEDPFSELDEVEEIVQPLPQFGYDTPVTRPLAVVTRLSTTTAVHPPSTTTAELKKVEEEEEDAIS